MQDFSGQYKQVYSGQKVGTGQIENHYSIAKSHVLAAMFLVFDEYYDLMDYHGNVPCKNILIV